jgi:D-arabinose 1-dehydrogenase-like Zn-dependent alcohol dehydrogenase
VWGRSSKALTLLRAEGSFLLLGSCHLPPKTNIPNVAMLSVVHGCVVRGIQGGSKQQLEEAVKLMGSRELLMPVTKTFDFNRDTIIAAPKYVASGEHIGKVCINLD